MIKISRDTTKIFNVVGDGIVATRAVTGYDLSCPAIIINAKEDKGVVDLLEFHKSIELGDVVLLWVRDVFDWDSYYLKMQFKHPMIDVFNIKFSLKRDFMIIDGIMYTRHFFLMVGEKGDKVSQRMNENRILVAVPDLNIDKVWAKMLMKILKQKFKNDGFNKREASRLIPETLNEFRKIWAIKLTPNNR